MKTISVRVKPNARTSAFEARADGTWHATLKAPPIEGRANEELIALVAAHFNVRKAQVTIKSGAAGRMKLVRIDDGA